MTPIQAHLFNQHQPLTFSPFPPAFPGGLGAAAAATAAAAAAAAAGGSSLQAAGAASAAPAAAAATPPAPSTPFSSSGVVPASSWSLNWHMTVLVLPLVSLKPLDAFVIRRPHPPRHGIKNLGLVQTLKVARMLFSDFAARREQLWSCWLIDNI
jgi:hypothetical protein